MKRLENLLHEEQADEPYAAGNEEANKARRPQNTYNGQIDSAQLNTTQDSVTIDNTVIEKVLQLGFTEDLVDKYLQAKDLNCATTSYFLINQKQLREQ